MRGAVIVAVELFLVWTILFAHEDRGAQSEDFRDSVRSRGDNRLALLSHNTHPFLLTQQTHRALPGHGTTHFRIQPEKIAQTEIARPCADETIVLDRIETAQRASLR